MFISETILIYVGCVLNSLEIQREKERKRKGEKPQRQQIRKKIYILSPSSRIVCQETLCIFFSPVRGVSTKKKKGGRSWKNTSTCTLNKSRKGSVAWNKIKNFFYLGGLNLNKRKEEERYCR